MSSSSSKPETKKKLLSLDSASLVDLKAEVFRKAQEAKFNQRHGGPNKTSNKEKKVDKWNQKNPGVQQRSVRDADQIEKEEEARRQLEKKAEMYDRLQREDGEDDRFLVDFGRKKKSPDDEWVEYTDALGRSRKCLKKDLPDLVRNDKELYKYKEEEARERELEEAKAADLMSEDMRRELLRQKWEKEEMENLEKRNVHYQDVLFDEARTHGAGFYRFSRDEVTRAAEQEELKDMHEETKKARIATERAKAKKKSAMAERLRKVKERKRLRKGLPIKSPDEDDEDKAEDGGGADSDGGATDMTSEADIMENLRAMREEEEDKKRRQRVRDWDVGKEGVETSRSTGRHYYTGASIAGLKGERKILSQGEWVDKKRTERPADFAPPSNYDKGAKRTQQGKRAPQAESGPSPKAARAPPPQQQPDPAAFAVPAGFGAGMANPGYGFGAPPPGPQDFGLKGPFSDPSFYHNTAQPPPPMGMYPPGVPPPGPAAYPPGPRTGGPPGFRPPGTSGFRPPGPPGPKPGLPPTSGPVRPIGPEMPSDLPGPQMPPPGAEEEEDPRPGPSSTSMSLGDRLKMHREMASASSGVGKPIVNEVNEGWRVFNEESSEEEEEEDNRGKGAEVAPPTSMDYFSSSTGYRKGFEYRKGFRSHEDMADSISAGMSKKPGAKDDAQSSDSD